MRAIRDTTSSPSLGREFASLLTAMPVPLVIIDSAGQIQTANQAIADLCDRDLNELQAMKLKDLVWGQDLDLYDKWFQTLGHGYKKRPQALRIRVGGNSQCLVRLHWVSVPNEHRDSQTIVQIEDIQVREDAENTLRFRTDLNQLLSSLSSNYETVTPEEVDRWLVNALGRIGSFIKADRCYIFTVSTDEKSVSNTHEWCAVGIKPQQENLQDIPTESMEWWMKVLRRSEVLNIPRVVDMGEEAAGERQILLDQGIQSLLVLPLIAGGRLVGFTGFDAVREEREWPEEAVLLLRASNSLFTSALVRKLMDSLQESEERYRTVVENGRSVIFRVDQYGRFTFLNKAWEELTSIPVESSIGKSVLDFVYPADREMAISIMTKVISGSEDPERLELRGFANNKLIWVEIIGRPLKDDDGNVIGYSGSIDDITERKNAQREAEVARQEAERASRAKSEFLSRMSHELRTPLNAIIGFSQLLEMGHLDAEKAENVSHIARAGDHLLDLINDVLDIVRIEAGEIPLDLEDIELAEVAGECLDLVRQAANQRNIQLKTVIGPDLLWLHTDRRRLKQVLINLLSNAVKYNYDGGKVVMRWTKTSGKVQIDIEDTGIGIPPSLVEDVFLPFQRLNADQTNVEGTGIGLAVTKNLVEVMGGTISVTSNPEEGSCFTIEFPTASDGSESESTLSQSTTPPEGESVLEGDNKQSLVLYIEDNPSNMTLLRRVLAYRPNTELLTATEGTTGLEIAKSRKPDLVLLDLHLPGIDGVEVLRKLSEDPDTKNIPVVILSADASQGQAKRLIEMGAKDYITKPIEVQSFLKSVEEYLGSGVVRSE